MHFSLKGKNMQSVSHEFFESFIGYFWRDQFLLSCGQSDISNQLPLGLILRTLRLPSKLWLKRKTVLLVSVVVKCCCFYHWCCLVTWSCFPSRPLTCEESKQTPFGHDAAHLKFQMKICTKSKVFFVLKKMKLKRSFIIRNVSKMYCIQYTARCTVHKNIFEIHT